MAQSRQNFSHRDGGHQSPGIPIGRGIAGEPANGTSRHFDDENGSEIHNDRYRYDRHQGRDRLRGNGAGDRYRDTGDYDSGHYGDSTDRSDRYPDDDDRPGYGEPAAEAGDESFYDSTNGSGERMSVSILLREAREDAGYSLRDVSSILRIRLAHLESIEDGRFDDLPGTVYAVGFVRAYSDLVGLDGEAMVKRFKDEVSGVPDQTELHFPTPASEGRVPGLGLVTIAVLLAGVAYGGWYYVSESDRGVGDFIPALPDRFAGLLDGWTGDTPPIDEIAASSDVEGSGTETNGNGAGSSADSASDPALPSVPGAGGTDSGEDTSDGIAALPESAAPVDPTGSSGALAGRDVTTPESQPSGSQGTSADTVDDLSGTGAAAELGDRLAASESQAGTGDDADTGDDAGISDGDGPQSPSVLATDTPSDTVVAVPGFDDPALADTDPDGVGQGGDDAEGSELGGATPNGDEVAAAENGVGNGGQQVLIRAESDSWVQIRDSLGSLLMTRVMRPGEVYEVPNESGLTMVTGNAGGLHVTVGGESAPPLGGSGDVVRGIRLEPDALLEGTAGP